MIPRLKEKYDSEIRDQLKEDLIHLESGENGLDEHRALNAARRQP